HNKKGKDSKNNMVTAEEGTFIITAKEGKKYEEAVENNDKLYQNTIMSNIRNKKQALTKKGKGSKKYQTGGLVDPSLLNPVPAGLGFNNSPTIPTGLSTPANLANPAISNLTAPNAGISPNWGN